MQDSPRRWAQRGAGQSSQRGDLDRAGPGRRRQAAQEAGDLLSVGSFSPLTPPKPGQAVTVRYMGLPDDPALAASFR